MLGNRAESVGTVAAAFLALAMIDSSAQVAAAVFPVMADDSSRAEHVADSAPGATTPQGGDVDLSFETGSSIHGRVHAVARQFDGRVLIGGNFTTVNRINVARLNTDGSLDTSFLSGLAGANGTVHSVAVQPDRRVLIGGSFTMVNGTSRGDVARLNADGSLDTSFLDGVAGANGTVYSFALQTDGRVLTGGDFTAVNGVSRNRLARLNADGSMDTAFLNGVSGANGTVFSLAVQLDGRVLIGGSFTAVNGVSRNRAARLNADGSLDVSFLNGLAGVNGAVHSLAVQSDGRVLVGGSFTTVNGVSRNYAARLNSDGSLDVSFLNGLAGANGTVHSLAVQSDGRVLIGGSFTTVNGVSRNYAARLNSNGSIDTSFLNGLAGANTDATDVLITCTPVEIGAAGSDNWPVTWHTNSGNGEIRQYTSWGDGGGFVGNDNSLCRTSLGFARLTGTYESHTFADVWGCTNGGGGTACTGSTGSTCNPVENTSTAPGKVYGLLSLDHNANGTTSLFAWNWVEGSYLTASQLYESTNDGASWSVVTGATFASANAPVGGASNDFANPTFIQMGQSYAFNTDGYVYLYSPQGAGLAGFGSVERVFLARVAKANIKTIAAYEYFTGTPGSPSWSTNYASRQPVLWYDENGDTVPDTDKVHWTMSVNYNPRLDRYFLWNNSAPNPSQSPSTDTVLDIWQSATPHGPWTLLKRFPSFCATTLSDDYLFSFFTFPAWDSTTDGGFKLAISGTGTNDRFAGLTGTYVVQNAPAADENGDLQSTVYSLDVQPDGRVLVGGLFSTDDGVSSSRVGRLHGSAPVVPAISSQPAARDSYSGSCAVLNVTATGTPRDYRWRKDGVDLVDGGAISGSASDMLTIEGLSSGDDGDYSVVVSNVLGSETSLDAALTVVSVPQCKVATCDPILGAVLVDSIDGVSCADGNACTTADACASGSCSGVMGALPAEVGSVSASKSGPTTAFGWSATVGASGYDMLRGKVRNWPVGSNPARENCLSGNVIGTTASDGTVPATADGYWYLFRAANACGNGSYGSQAVHGVPTVTRVSGTCP